MCALCERAAALRTTAADEFSSSVALAFGTDPLATNLLIDTSNASFSEQLVASDGVMHLYLHTSGGAVEVAGGGFGTQTIQSVVIPQQDQDYIRSIVSRLDAIIDLDFDFVGTAREADTAFYYDTEIDFGGSGNTLGLAITGTRGWELFVNQPEVANNRDYRQYVNLHEWGHSLGLEHPFEDADGDVYNGNLDPWTSAYPEETVMAYRNPLSGDWPDFFSTSDLNALIEIWGAETRFLGDGGQTFVGEDYREVIEGGSGDDRFEGAGGDDVLVGFRGFDLLKGGSGDDTLQGGNGRDTLSGGLGSDLIYGGFGRNTYTSERDGSIDHIFLKSDQWAENWLYGSAGNNPDGEKADILEGLDASDRVFVQGVSTDMLTVVSTSHTFGDGQVVEGLGIFAAGYLEAVYTGRDLSSDELLSITSGIVI